MIGLALLVLLVALGAASALGLTADTRDPRYGLGPVRRSNSEKSPEGVNSAD